MDAWHLVIQGEDVSTPDLKALYALARGRAIERIDGNAFRITHADPLTRRLVAEHCAPVRLDWGFVPAARKLADFGLLAMDMDSTLITIECIDEIADFAGRKAEVAAVTAAAMRGEIDWPQSLRQRVRALAGLPVSSLGRVYDERLRFTPGAARLVALCKQQGIRTLLVSGGFTYFTDRVRDQLGLDWAYANHLDIEASSLAGTVSGDLVDAQGKARWVAHHRDALGLSRDQVAVVGDGANDLAMMAEAGTSIAFHAKPVVKERATYALDYSGLDGVSGLLSAGSE